MLKQGAACTQWLFHWQAEAAFFCLVASRRTAAEYEGASKNSDFFAKARKPRVRLVDAGGRTKQGTGVESKAWSNCRELQRIKNT